MKTCYNTSCNTPCLEETMKAKFMLLNLRIISCENDIFRLLPECLTFMSILVKHKEIEVQHISLLSDQEVYILIKEQNTTFEVTKELGFQGCNHCLCLQ